MLYHTMLYYFILYYATLYYTTILYYSMLYYIIIYYIIFIGAETGTGGRLRDVQATGRGAHTLAGISSYCVGIE